MKIKLQRGTKYLIEYCNWDEQERYIKNCDFIGCCKDIDGHGVYVFQDFQWYYTCYPKLNLLSNSEEISISFEVDKRDNNFSGLRITTKEWARLRLAEGEESI